MGWCLRDQGAIFVKEVELTIGLEGEIVLVDYRGILLLVHRGRDHLVVG